MGHIRSGWAGSTLNRGTDRPMGDEPDVVAPGGEPLMRTLCRHRRSRRVVALVPAVVIAWGLVAGLPLTPTPGQPGRLETSTVQLTGAGAPALAPATGALDAAGDSRAKARATSGPAAEGWSAAVDLAERTQMVAVTWARAGAPADAAVAVRSRHDRAWSPWQTLTADPDEGPDSGGNGRAGVGPVWLGADGADRVEVRVQRGRLDAISMLRMRWIEPTPGSGPAPADAEPAGPGIIGRSAWAPGGWRGDNPGCAPSPTVMDQLRFAVVHHTVNANDYSASQVAGILAGIYRYHTQSLGWCDIAYNFLIDRFGQVWQGRSGDIAMPVMGGHAKGFNTDSVGVAFLGQHQPGAAPAAVRPTSAQIGALRSLLAWKLSIHGVDPAGTVGVRTTGSTRYAAGTTVSVRTISGHRDVGLTSCPGDYLYAVLSSLRTAVVADIANARTPSRWAPFTTPRSLAARQFYDFLGRHGTNTYIAYWASRLQRDGQAPEPLIAGLVSSAEFDARRAPIARLYLAYLRRVPDAKGLHALLGAFRDGTPLSDISQMFAASEEFARRYGPLTNPQFVQVAYRNVYGREPSTTELFHWSAQLERRAMTRGQVMVAFTESAEGRLRSAIRVQVIMTVDAMTRRRISDTGYANWVLWITNGGTITQLIAQLFHSDEYRLRVT